MDFGSAFDLGKDFDFNKAAERAKEQITKTLREFGEQVGKNVRKDWARSKTEAKQFWEHAAPATLDIARQIMEATEQFSGEIAAELKAVRQQLETYLVSPEFETQLDAWLTSAALHAKYERFRNMRRASFSDFADVNASITEDTLETADPFRSDKDDLDERRVRIREKLAFLYRHHCDEVLDAAKKGAVLGGPLGPDTAMRFALIAGGLRLGLIIGGVSCTILKLAHLHGEPIA